MVGSTSAALNLSPTHSATVKVDDSSRTGEREHGREGPPTHKTVQAYARPLKELVSVAREGEVGSLRSHANALQARAIRLTSIAETAAGAVKHNPKLMK